MKTLYDLDHIYYRDLSAEERAAWAAACRSASSAYEASFEHLDDSHAFMHDPQQWQIHQTTALAAARVQLNQLPIHWQRWEDVESAKRHFLQCLFGYIATMHFPYHTRDAFERLNLLAGRLFMQLATCEADLDHITRTRPLVRIDEYQVSIADDEGVIVSRNRGDFTADSEHTFAALTALKMAYEQGPQAVRQQRDHPVELPPATILVYDDSTGIQHWRIALTAPTIGIDPETDRWIEDAATALAYVQELQGRGYALAAHPANLSRWSHLQRAVRQHTQDENHP